MVVFGKPELALYPFDDLADGQSGWRDRLYQNGSP